VRVRKFSVFRKRRGLNRQDAKSAKEGRFFNFQFSGRKEG